MDSTNRPTVTSLLIVCGIIILIWCVIWGLVTYQGGDWDKFLSRPVSELKVWHLIVLLIVCRGWH